MNDPESRLNDALLPIGQNSVGQDQGRGRNQVVQPQTSVFQREDTWLKTKKCCWWTTVIFVVVTVFLILSLRLFFFKPIDHKPPTLDNSTALEPNTKTRFRLMIEGTHAHPQSLIGLSVWAYRVPIPTHPQIAIAAVGYYIERGEGKRRLKRFQGEEITDDNFPDVESALLKTGMTESLRYVLATTPPSGRMLQMFQDNTEPILKRICPKIAEEEFQKFSSFFPDSKTFEKGEDFTFEWRDGDQLYGYWEDQRLKAVRVATSCMAKALFESQLEAQRSALVNLLGDFLEK